MPKSTRCNHSMWMILDVSAKCVLVLISCWYQPTTVYSFHEWTWKKNWKNTILFHAIPLQQFNAWSMSRVKTCHIQWNYLAKEKWNNDRNYTTEVRPMKITTEETRSFLYRVRNQLLIRPKLNPFRNNSVELQHKCCLYGFLSVLLVNIG